MSEIDNLLECADFDLRFVKAKGCGTVMDTTRGPLNLGWNGEVFVLAVPDGEEIARGDAATLRHVLVDLYDRRAILGEGAP